MKFEKAIASKNIDHLKSIDLNNVVNSARLYAGLWSCHVDQFEEGFEYLFSSQRLWYTAHLDLHSLSCVKPLCLLFEQPNLCFINRFLNTLTQKTDPKGPSMSLAVLISYCMDTTHSPQELVRQIVTHPSLLNAPHVQRMCYRLIRVWQNTENHPSGRDFYKEECWNHLKATMRPSEFLDMLGMCNHHVELSQGKKDQIHQQVFKWIDELFEVHPKEWFDELLRHWRPGGSFFPATEKLFVEQKNYVLIKQSKQDLQQALVMPSLSSSPRKM